ncbi:nesprin-1 [Acipenser oxyrinchus oxyrinchus]|uniref:Nesprin-1 n=1 Tax=Acipenser oxyrinchus oxyrinchus TaxID=40147 RepID=A0AAD8FRH5_ACIOX|nr:nesprin-1 [Acipenser oxyrinchus oxyrinchus]
MTYVAQFLQYSKDLPVSEEEMQLYVTSPQTPSPVRLSPRLTQAISSPNLQKGNLNQKSKESRPGLHKQSRSWRVHWRSR